jgi:1-phosphofructokinase
MSKSIFTLTLNPCFDQTKYTSNSLLTGAILKEDKEEIIAGGKGVNISKVLASMEIHSKAVILAGVTNGSEEIKINQKGYEFSKTEMSRVKTKVWNLIDKDQIWILAGSLPPSIDPDFYTKIIDLIKSAGSQVWLDTSGPALDLAIQSKVKPDLIKPNRSELQAILNQELATDWQELTKQIQTQLIRNSNMSVMLTMDKDGCLLVNREEGIHTPIIKGIQAVNTVGAGDSFLAGLVAGYSLGLDDVHSLDLATCVANLTVSKPLGQYPTMPEVSNMLKVNFVNNFPIEHLE